MKKAYVILPTLLMLIFFGFWWNFKSDYEAQQAAEKEQKRLEKIAKLEKEAMDRKKAIEDALASQEVRKKEKAERDAKLQADREQRQADIEARRQADREQQKLARQVTRLQADVYEEKQLLEDLEEQKRVLIAEEAFLLEYVAKANKNEESVTKVILRIQAADAARAKAVAAAAAAAKS